MKNLKFILIILLIVIFAKTNAQNYIKEFQQIEEMVSIADTLFFVADDGIHGKELWRSDGTTEGTFLIKDIANGDNDAAPANLTVFNNEVYFSAYDAIYGTELWKTNGTEQGTVMVSNIKPDTDTYNNGSSPNNLILYNNNIFFIASDDGNEGDLWKTDGTDIGTIKVYETDYIGIGDLTVVEESLFFVRYYGPRQLWKYDNLSGDAVEIPIDDYYFIAELNSFNDNLYFITHTTYRNDIRLYKLTADNNLTLLKEYTQPQYGDLDIDNFVEVNQTVFFSIRTDYDNDPETDVLWKTDGTPTGTVEVKSFDWDYHSSESYMSDFIGYNNELYFRSGDETNCTLWKSDGTETGTVQVSETELSKEYGSLTISDNKLYFCGYRGWDIDYELWTSDGTEQGTNIFANLKLDGSSYPSNLCDVNGALYFTANNGTGLTLWNNIANPEITIKNGWNNLESGETVNFNTIKVDSVEIKEFVIENKGLKELIISKITASNGDFFISNQKKLILPNESDILTIYFYPSSEGVKTGTITINCNDRDESTFIIHLEGIAEGYITSPSISNDIISIVSIIDYNNLGDTINLSNNIIDENLPLNTIVGNFEILGEDVSEWNFSFISGIGDEDNDNFNINTNSLLSYKAFDYEIQNTYTVRVKASNNTSEKTYEQNLIILVNNLNETPEYDECEKIFYNLCYALNDVEFINSETVFAVGDDGVILKSTNAGINWTSINSGTKASLYKLQFVTENVGYIIGGYGDIIIKTENGGNNWFPLDVKNPDYPYISNLFFITENKGFVIGGEGKIFRTSDGGRTWDFQKKGYEDLHSVFFVNETTGFITGSYNTFYKTIDFGENWILIDMPDIGWGSQFGDICFTNELTGYILCSDGELLKTVDAGNTWTQINKISTDYATDMYFVDESVGYIIGNWFGGDIHKTQDAGVTWQEIDYETTYNLSSLSAISFNSNGDKGCIVGDAAGYGSTSESGRIVLCSDNNGNAWQNTNFINGNENFKEIAFFDDGVGYVFGGDYYSDVIGFKTFDGGITWQEVSPPATGDYSWGTQSCHFISKDTIYLIETDSVFLTTDGGITWKGKEEFNADYNYYFVNNNVIYGVFSFNTDEVFKSIDAGQTWNLIHNGGSWITHIYFHSENLGFLLGYNIILKTEDGGITWSEYNHNLNKALRSIYFIDNNTIFIGGDNGTLLKSNNAGNTWTNIATGITTDIIDIKFYDNKNGIILTNNGGWGLSGLYSTSDAGETWTNVSQISNDTYEAFVTESNETYIIGDRGTLLKYSQSFQPSQAGYAIGDNIVCQNEISNYKTANSPYFDYIWTVDNNQNISFSNDIAIINWSETGMYNVELKPVNACGEGLSQTLTVNVNDLPSPEIMGKDTVLQNEINVIYNSNQHFDDRILWSVTGAELSEILTENNITTNWGALNGNIDLIQTTPTGCRQIATKTIIIKNQKDTSEHDTDFEIIVFPNPTSDYINIKLQNSNEENIIASLYDNLGTQINKYEISNSEGSIYVGNLTYGIYLLNINNGLINKTLKIIIK